MQRPADWACPFADGNRNAVILKPTGNSGAPASPDSRAVVQRTMVGELKSITLTKTPTGKSLNSNSSTALDHSYFVSRMGGALSGWDGHAS
jgi:hypothetical protein